MIHERISHACFPQSRGRLADLLRRERKVTYRASIDARIAPYVTPLLDKLVADDEDGETLRDSLIPWRRTERPPIAIYRGDLSTCRIDGPWQVAGDQWLPLGGLILSPGVTPQLDPFEAQALHRQRRQAIEHAILAWIREHDLYALRHVPEEIDREAADRAATSIIAAWVARQRKAETGPGEGIGCPEDCCSGTLCEAGAAVVLTFQALGQMRHRYGPQVAESMLGCCNTKLFLQIIDSETRRWASQTIGECEVEIQTMTDALAEGDDAPRTTLGRMRKMRPAVLESELRLPKFEGYLLFPDGLPVARVRLTADHVTGRGKPRQPGFVAGDPANSLWEQTTKATASVAPPSPSSSPPPTSDGPV